LENSRPVAKGAGKCGLGAASQPCR
jgi:hypothetical protein